MALCHDFPDIAECPYLLKLDAGRYHVRFGPEVGDFPANGFSGLGYVLQLLAKPYQWIEALDLVGCEVTFARDGKWLAQFRCDAAGLEKYLRQFEALDEQLAEAQKHHDLATVEKRQLAMEQLLVALGCTDDLDTRGSPVKKLDRACPAMKARERVRAALGRALTRVGKSMPAFAEHIRNSVQTAGTAFMYNPPRPAPDWEC